MWLLAYAPLFVWIGVIFFLSSNLGSAAHTFVGPLSVSSDQHGGALAAWGWQDGIGQQAHSGAAEVRVTGGAVSTEKPAPSGLVSAFAYGNGRSVELASIGRRACEQEWDALATLQHL